MATSNEYAIGRISSFHRYVGDGILPLDWCGDDEDSLNVPD
jgi:hypothetical protein